MKNKITDSLYAATALKRVEVLVIGPDDTDLLQGKAQLLNDFTQLRTNYVLQEGWPIHATMIDIDVYDSAAKTWYVLAYDKTTMELLAGLRLTKISSVLGSLSYSMWQHAVDRVKFDQELNEHSHEIGKMEQASRTNDLWDVTRFMTRSSVVPETNRRDKIAERIGIVKVLAAAIHVSGEHAQWVFTVGDKMFHFMNRSNFLVSRLASGRIGSHEETEAHLCVADIRLALEHLAKHNKTAHSVAQNTLRKRKEQLV